MPSHFGDNPVLSGMILPSNGRIMDRLEAMTIVVTVIDKGSLSAAGRDLDVPLATVSRKVKELETLLGTRLLIRTTRKVTLTDAGIAYVAAARRILDQVDETERDAAGDFTTPKGELIITAPDSLRAFARPARRDRVPGAYPEINVRLLLSDRNLDLIDDHVDMAVRIGPLPDSTMIATRSDRCGRWYAPVLR